MIDVTDLVKTFDGGVVRAVDGVSFEIPSGQLLTLLGASGSGKTTTMRAIAGLERPDAGTIRIGDDVVYSSEAGINLRPNKRRVGMVFQSYAIWPHMTVIKNVAYPLTGKGIDKAEVRRRSFEALEMVGLDKLAERPAPNLSGGQQQRVALARALVAQPKVLLLDEPLSNLDAKLREVMRREIRDLQRDLGITTVYVTHDQEEALAISDVVAVMADGRVIDFGPPERIYAEPASRQVAEFIGMANIIDVERLRRTGDGWTGESSLGPLTVATEPTSDPCAVLIRLEDLEIVSEASAGDANVWPATVVSSLYLGSHVDCEFDVNGTPMRAEIPGRARPQVGDRLHVHVSPSLCYVLPADDRGDAREAESVGSHAAG